VKYLSFLGDHYTNAASQPSSTEQDKTLLNVRLGWRNDNWDAAVWVKNATDEAYSNLSLEPVAFSGTAGEYLEPPRTWGVTVRYTF
jgi:iron complex outermembrane receptor protein